MNIEDPEFEVEVRVQVKCVRWDRFGNRRGWGGYDRRPIPVPHEESPQSDAPAEIVADE